MTDSTMTTEPVTPPVAWQVDFRFGPPGIVGGSGQAAIVEVSPTFFAQLPTELLNERRASARANVEDFLNQFVGSDASCREYLRLQKTHGDLQNQIGQLIQRLKDSEAAYSDAVGSGADATTLEQTIEGTSSHLDLLIRRRDVLEPRLRQAGANAAAAFKVALRAELNRQRQDWEHRRQVALKAVANAIAEPLREFILTEAIEGVEFNTGLFDAGKWLPDLPSDGRELEDLQGELLRRAEQAARVRPYAPEPQLTPVEKRVTRDPRSFIGWGFGQPAAAPAQE